jgi:hypothetical protein
MSEVRVSSVWGKYVQQDVAVTESTAREYVQRVRFMSRKRYVWRIKLGHGHHSRSSGTR